MVERFDSPAHDDDAVNGRKQCCQNPSEKFARLFRPIVSIIELMNPPSRRIAVILVITLFAISSGFAAGTRNSFNPRQFSTGNFKGCPPQGHDPNGRSDPDLSVLKNRDIAPTTARPYTVTSLVNQLPTTLPRGTFNDPRPRSGWTSQQKDLAARSESRAVIVTGYLVNVIREKAEGCNCESTKYVDHHLWLAPTPNSPISQAMVVEVSPRLWPRQPKWSKTATFQSLVDAKSKVRVTGWLMWDQEHREQLGKRRKTLWEVHPIHQIQVQRGNKWVNL